MGRHRHRHGRDDEYDDEEEEEEEGEWDEELGPICTQTEICCWVRVGVLGVMFYFHLFMGFMWGILFNSRFSYTADNKVLDYLIPSPLLINSVIFLIAWCCSIMRPIIGAIIAIVLALLNGIIVVYWYFYAMGIVCDPGPGRPPEPCYVAITLHVLAMICNTILAIYDFVEFMRQRRLTHQMEVERELARID